MTDLEYLDEYSSLIAQSMTASDFCRKLTHSNVLGTGATGSQLFVIDQQARFSLIGGYGQALQLGELTVWDQHPYAEAVRDNKVTLFDGSLPTGHEVVSSCLPVSKGAEPTGCLIINRQPGSKQVSIADHAMSAIAKITAIWIDSLGVTNHNGNSHPNTGSMPSPETLTDRQLTVLRLMAEGKTNAQIAQELILSESTIRQETVKVYRALSVGSRTEASKRALHLGLLNKSSI